MGDNPTSDNSSLPVARDPQVLECPDCGALEIIPIIHSGRLQCWQCKNTLERATGRSADAALACGLATFFFLIPAVTLPLLHFSYAGIEGETRVPAGVSFLWHEQWVLTAAVVALQVMILPFLRFGLLATSLTAVKAGLQAPWVGPFFRWAEKLDPWAMPDVFLIGCAIGYSRIEPYAPVTVGAGGLCMVGAAFMAMMTRACLDRRSIWRLIAAPPAVSPEQSYIACNVCDLLVPAASEGSRCPRCGQRIWKRKPNALTYATALTIGGLILYPVANIYPMSMFTSPIVHTSHTIFTGVQDLVQAGLFPLACLIFTTSIAIPFVKLAAMGWFIVSLRKRSTRKLRVKTRLYRVINDVGRWSNMDVYTIAVFTPMVQFGQIASFHAGIGTPAFLGVVVLTMFASESFDPRLMWDAAGANP